MDQTKNNILSIICITAIVLIVYFTQFYLARAHAAETSADSTGMAYLGERPTVSSPGFDKRYTETDPYAYAYLRRRPSPQPVVPSDNQVTGNFIWHE